ncbi:MAG: cupin domain-containing protein, partial [Clostridia bacterium]|nr:cupin domain-containing protein [Clostridia bacterium]
MDNFLWKACETLQNMDIQFRVDNLFIKVDFIRVEAFKPGMTFDEHAHSNLEFHYIKSGHGNVVMNGSSFPLNPGDLYVTGSGLLHSQEASKQDPMLEYALKCSLSLEKRPAPDEAFGEEEYVYMLLENSPTHVAQDRARVDELFEALFHEAYAMKPGYLGQIKALVYRIIITMARALDIKANTTYTVPYRDLSNYRMDSIKRYIADNIKRNITCEELSQYLFLSEKQLSRVIKSKTGLSTHDFVLEEKLRVVKQLLENKNLTLSQIADQTGFSSEFHLSSTFRRKVGTSPFLYRNQMIPGSVTNSLYPLTFKPLYKNYIWGGSNLKKVGKAIPEMTVAESWEISTHHDGMNVVAEGAFAGSTLEDMGLEFGERFLGTLSMAQYKKKFPLLLKFIDANDWLSVQVHPEDAYAKIHENDLGKTEMWYILEAIPDATILYGLTREMTREEFEKQIQAGRISSLLKSVKVAAGDVVFIPAGTVHSAGKGILMAEVQQNSNATYRLYDFDRKNPDGTARPLHVTKALDSIRFDRATLKGKFPGLVYEKDGVRIKVLVADSHFCAELIEVSENGQLFADGRSFVAYTFLEGSAELTWDTGSMKVREGQSILIPASLGTYAFKGQIKALKAYIGDIKKDILSPLETAGYTKEQMMESIGGLGL